MFPGMADKGLDIGARNERAVLDALRHAGVRVDASETGGGKGRTIRVDLGKGRVTVKEAGGRETPVLEVR
jgi:chemotaxis protein CheD